MNTSTQNTATSNCPYLNAILTKDAVQTQVMYNDLLPFVTSFVKNRGGSVQDAEDVFQDAMLVMYEKAASGKLVLTSAFKAFFITICKYTWYNKIDKKSRTEVSIDDDDLYTQYEDETDIENSIVELEEQTLFAEKVQELPSQSQQLVEFWMEGKRHEEIMDLMGFGSVGYAKKRRAVVKNRLITSIMQDPRYRELAAA